MAFNGKVVLVTGASSGIGAASAILFAKEGASVSLVGRNEKKLRNVEKECGQKAFVIVADIGDTNNCKLIVDKTVEKFGKLDVLVNNAGVAVGGKICDANALATFDSILNTNLRAVISITSAAAPHLIASKGNIVNVSSVSALMYSATMWAYCASKAGLDSFTKSMALHFAPHGVRVNSINPGPVKTDIVINMGLSKEISDLGFAASAQHTALKRSSESEEIGDIIIFLASDKARGITGSIIVHDNGAMLKGTLLSQDQ